MVLKKNPMKEIYEKFEFLRLNMVNLTTNAY